MVTRPEEHTSDHTKLHPLVTLVVARDRRLAAGVEGEQQTISMSPGVSCGFSSSINLLHLMMSHTMCIACIPELTHGSLNLLPCIVSLVSLSILSYERYTTVLRSSQVDIYNFRKAWLCIGGSWLYSLLWTSPPFLGWSSYGPEGPGTTCSIQWHLRSPTIVSYVLCLFIFCLLLPLLIMVYSYG
ncbi:hypothetical protein PAMP_023894 [Pampus punctatissimus]